MTRFAQVTILRSNPWVRGAVGAQVNVFPASWGLILGRSKSHWIQFDQYVTA